MNLINYKYLSLLISVGLFFSLSSCKKEQFSDVSVCESSNPVEEVKWLQQVMTEPKSVYLIALYELEGRKLVEVYPTYSSCFGCHFYTCEGELLTLKPDNFEQLKKIKTIWPKE